MRKTPILCTYFCSVFFCIPKKKELHGELHIIIMKVLYQNVPQLKNPQIRLSFLTGEFFSNGLILEMYDYSPLPNFRTMSFLYPLKTRENSLIHQVCLCFQEV